MLIGTGRLLSKAEYEQKRNEKIEEIKSIVNEEYEKFKQFINIEQLPEIKKIEVLLMQGCDAAVSPLFEVDITLRIDEKFLKERNREYLKIVLFHEFTHIWDRVAKYGSPSTSLLTEYHAVQIAFIENLGQKNIETIDEFSEKQFVWEYDKKITVKEFWKKKCEHYSYRMEYHYYKESEDRTYEFMYNLCQWMGYSIILEKYCKEWHELKKNNVFIPKELETEVKQFYISLRDGKEKKQIEKNYRVVYDKFYWLNKVQWTQKEKENFFLREKDKNIGVCESLKYRCEAIEEICLDMKEKRKSFTNPALNRSFVLEYFAEIYQNMRKEKNYPYMLTNFLEYFFQNVVSKPEQQACDLKELETIFESKRFGEGAIRKIESLGSVKKEINDDGKRVYRILNIEIFVSEMGFTTAFLAALLKGINDAGYLLEFKDNGILIKDSVAMRKKI